MKFYFPKFWLNTIIVVLVSTLVSACGFQLRGSYLVPDELYKVSLTSYDRYGTLTREVKRLLQLKGVTIVPPSEEVANLHIVSESSGAQTVSLYQNTQAAEKSLNYSASYRVTLPGIGQQTFSTKTNRNYLYSSVSALAKSVEKDLLEDEMRTEAATQIIRKLASLKADFDKGELVLEEEAPQVEAKP